MSTPDPEAVTIAAQMISRYLAGHVDAMSDPLEDVLGDPRILGEVMAQLTVIAGQLLTTSTEGTGADPTAILRDMVERLGGTLDEPWAALDRLRCRCQNVVDCELWRGSRDQRGRGHRPGHCLTWSRAAEVAR